VADTLPQERNRALRVLDVDVAPELDRLRLVVEASDASVPRSLVHVRLEITVGAIPGILGPAALVIRARRSVPLIESVIGRPAPILGPEMPLAKARRRVSRLGQDVGDCSFPGD